MPSFRSFLTRKRWKRLGPSGAALLMGLVFLLSFGAMIVWWVDRDAWRSKVLQPGREPLTSLFSASDPQFRELVQLSRAGKCNEFEALARDINVPPFSSMHRKIAKLHAACKGDRTTRKKKEKRKRRPDEAEHRYRLAAISHYHASPQFAEQLPRKLHAKHVHFGESHVRLFREEEPVNGEEQR
jgi:hypothetical protein